MKQKIVILTNDLKGGWSPLDKETGMGGSEEAITKLASEFVKNNFEVVLYHVQRKVVDFVFDGVTFSSRHNFKCEEKDILITFKDSTPWKQGINVKKNIHFSLEVERPWNISNVDHFVHTSKFHESRHPWVSRKKSEVVPLGVELSSLDKNKESQIPNTVLYASSPDRGLELLLHDWDVIYKNNPELILNIAYGFRIFESCGHESEQVLKYKQYMLGLMNKPNINYLGNLGQDEIEKEYWMAQYWILPLLKPESELFCLNAVKSRYCGAISIVNKMGALKETVSEYIPYGNFLENKMDLEKAAEKSTNAIDWKEVVEKYWLKILN